MMVIENKFELNQIVFIRVDPDQRERIVVQIVIGANGSVRYCLSGGTNESWHYDTELSTEKNVLVS